MHRCEDLINLFESCFLKEFNTLLMSGGQEPIYLPANRTSPHNRIVFTRDYYSSGLHEIAHWCIAGEQRRRLEDYGYWYSPDGRSEQQQRQFERVEIKPQALEWLFNQAAGLRFRLSADNLSAGIGASPRFAENVFRQAVAYCERGVNLRAHRFILALQQFYDTPNPFLIEHYSMDHLLT